MNIDFGLGVFLTLLFIIALVAYIGVRWTNEDERERQRRSRAAWDTSPGGQASQRLATMAAKSIEELVDDIVSNMPAPRRLKCPIGDNCWFCYPWLKTSHDRSHPLCEATWPHQHDTA